MSAQREVYQQQMILGGLICLAGIFVTVASYSAAAGGGTYVFAWGAIVVGGLRFFHGLSGAMTS
jgi:hypothetical protein